MIFILEQSTRLFDHPSRKWHTVFLWYLINKFSCYWVLPLAFCPDALLHKKQVGCHYKHHAGENIFPYTLWADVYDVHLTALLTSNISELTASTWWEEHENLWWKKSVFSNSDYFKMNKIYIFIIYLYIHAGIDSSHR